MTEVSGRDAMIAARRCVEAAAETDDVKTRRALWKAALRYHQRVREERMAGEFHPLLTPTHAPGDEPRDDWRVNAE